MAEHRDDGLEDEEDGQVVVDLRARRVARGHERDVRGNLGEDGFGVEAPLLDARAACLLREFVVEVFGGDAAAGRGHCARDVVWMSGRAGSGVRLPDREEL